MIDAVIQIVMALVLICGGITIGVSLLKMHRDRNQPSLSDLVTSTNKKGRVYLDPRKCFEAGSFLLTTWIMVYLTGSGKMSIEYFTVFLGVWTTARYLRDREKRLAEAK